MGRSSLNMFVYPRRVGFIENRAGFHIRLHTPRRRWQQGPMKLPALYNTIEHRELEDSLLRIDDLPAQDRVAHFGKGRRVLRRVRTQDHEVAVHPFRDASATG